MRERIVAVVIGFLLLGFVADAHAASFKEWRKAIREADEARIKRDFKSAQQILERIAPEAAKHGPESYAENAELLGLVLIESGESGSAAQVLTEALGRMGNTGRKNFILWKGLLYARRATALKELKSYNEALADAEQARFIIGKAAGFFHPELSNIHWLIGEIASARKDYTKAEAAYRAGLDIAETRMEKTAFEGGLYRRYLSDYSSSGILLNTAGLGEACMMQNREKESEAYFTKGLKFAEKEYGRNHQAVVVPLSGRATLHHKMKRRAEFDEDARRVIEISEKKPGIKVQYSVPLWLKFGWELDETNRLAAAETADKIASVFAVQNYGMKALAAGALKTASLERKDDRARVAQVQEMVRKAVAGKLGESPTVMSPLLAEFALDAERARELGMARFHYETILKMHEKGGDPGLYAATAEKIADILIAQNKPAEALPYLQKVTVKIREKYAKDSRIGFAMEREATVLRQLGRVEEAKEMEAKALAEHAKAMLKR